MLHSIVIISASGILLFSKEFIHGPNKVGGLSGILAALSSFSLLRVGLDVDYIALSKIGIAITKDYNTNITAATFHDREDGSEFGQLMGREILTAFIQNYSATLKSSSLHASSSSSDLFHDFNGKIAVIMRNSVKTIMTNLEEQRGILVALLATSSSSSSSAPSLSNSHSYTDTDSLIMNDRITNNNATSGNNNTNNNSSGNGSLSGSGNGLGSGRHLSRYNTNNNIGATTSSTTTSSTTTGGAGAGGAGTGTGTGTGPGPGPGPGAEPIDHLAILANHQALIGAANDIMSCRDDSCLSVVLKSRRTTLVLHRIERSSLIVVFKNSTDPVVCLSQIEKTATLIKKVLVMASNLKTS